MTTKQQIEFLTALNKNPDAELQFKSIHEKGGWETTTRFYALLPDFSRYDYRIKPELRVIYMNEYPNGQMGIAYNSLDMAARMACGVNAIRTAVRFVESPE